MCFRNVGGRHSVQEESAKEVVKERGASSPGGERCAACRIRHKLPLMLTLLLQQQGGENAECERNAGRPGS